MSIPRQKHSSSLLERETACPEFLQNPNIWSFCIAWQGHIYCLQQSGDSQMIHLKPAALTIDSFLSQQGIKMKNALKPIPTLLKKKQYCFTNTFICAALLVPKMSCMSWTRTTSSCYFYCKDDPCGVFATRDSLGFLVQIPNCPLRTQSLLHWLGSQAAMHMKPPREAHSR